MSYGGAVTQNESNRRVLERDGYVWHFACTYGHGMPSDLNWPKKADGWSRRRSLKSWCALRGICDYRIHVDTSYQHDLHGPRVYELWIKGVVSPL